MIIGGTTENTLISKADLVCCCLPDIIRVIFHPPEILLRFFFNSTAYIVRESKEFLSELQETTSLLSYMSSSFVSESEGIR